MQIAEFARKYRLKVRRDECGDPVIQKGRAGSISEDRDGLLSLTVMFDTRRKWSAVRRKLVKAGFVIQQEGETEGVLTFNPADRKAARLAVSVARVRRTRVLSLSQKRVLRKRMAEVRASKAA